MEDCHSWSSTGAKYVFVLAWDPFRVSQKLATAQMHFVTVLRLSRCVCVYCNTIAHFEVWAGLLDRTDFGFSLTHCKLAVERKS
jgi:hypothetical protein